MFTLGPSGEKSPRTRRAAAVGLTLALAMAATAARDAEADAPPGLFVVSADGTTVVDTQTGLEWQRNSTAGGSAGATAESYCDGIRLGGHLDWRVPTILELASIVDDQEANGFDEDVFTRSANGYDWFVSSTRNVSASDGSLWCVYYGQSLNCVNGLVRCVR